MHDPLIGTVLGTGIGDVRLIARIGSGTVGTVYRGACAAVGRDLAVKVIREDHTAEERGRFLREGEAASRIHSDRVVRVYGSGEIGSNAYLLLELVAGESLGARLERCGVLSPLLVLPIAIDCACGLTALHHVGVLHRDIKPDNILLGQDGHAKIADLGLAKIPDNRHLTTVGALVGTPRYVAPEAILTPSALGPAGDVYGLGASLYHALAGEPAYPGEDPLRVIEARLAHDPPPLLGRCPDLPPSLVDIIMRMLEREPENRPTAPQVLADLLAMQRTRAR